MRKYFAVAVIVAGGLAFGACSQGAASPGTTSTTSAPPSTSVSTVATTSAPTTTSIPGQTLDQAYAVRLAVSGAYTNVYPPLTDAQWVSLGKGACADLNGGDSVGSGLDAALQTSLAALGVPVRYLGPVAFAAINTWCPSFLEAYLKAD